MSATTRGVAKPEVAHDGVLQVLGLGDGDSPVLGVWDRRADVEVVGHDLGPVEQGEAELEQVLGGGVDPAEQHALVADVAKAHVVQRAGGLGDQGGELVGVVDVVWRARSTER